MALPHSSSLGRLVADENSASDLLGFLFELDPDPLVRVLKLVEGGYTCHREVPVRGSRKGRLDFVLRHPGNGHPAAVLEMKGASGVHGDQLDRYDSWAESFGSRAPQRFYCTLEGDGFVPPAPWQRLNLADVFGSWRGSPNAHAAWLAGEIEGVLRSWVAEADGIIGNSTGWYVADLVSRRVASSINTRLLANYQDGSCAQADRTNAGNPMVIAWRRHPRGSDAAWVGVDIRCEGRSNSSVAWLFRPCIDIDPVSVGAHLEAHDLAVALQPAMVLPAIEEALIRRGYPALGAALSAGRYDGLAGPADPVVLDDCRARIIGGAGPGRRHPVFFHDRGLRIATQLRVDVTLLTRFELADLAMEVLDHLVEHAR